ncbi:MAG TPA: c-type cytochrome, partial [Turneriella sp.]|nr:c-type cytochrome [Turneriella sp.]
MLKNTAILSLCFLFFSYGVLAEDPGQKIFNEKCTACHTIGKGKTVGPDLKGVTTRRDPQWLTRWIMEPDKALAEKDETALALLKEFNNVPMPNFGITEAQAKDIIAYLGSGDAGAETKVEISWSKSFSFTDIGTAQLTALVLFLILSTVIVVVFMMIARSTRQSQPTIDMKAAYKIRAKFFVIATVIVVGTLWATLSRTPYPKTKENPNEPVKVIYVTAEQFNFSYSEAPILTMEDKKTVPLISALTIPPGTLVEFQVTSID